MTWTLEHIEKLRALWAHGYSCSYIARQIGGGISRNAVIGKASRLGLPRRPTPLGNHHVRYVKISSTKVKRVPVPAFVPLDDPPFAERVSTINLTDKTCRWPIGDPDQPGFAFCGRLPREDSPYCPTHFARAYGRESSGYVKPSLVARAA